MKKMTAVMAILMVAGVAQAFTVDVDVTSAPTTDMPGYNTYTISFTGDEDIWGAGIDAQGPMNQINPLGNSSIFDESNGFMPLVGASVDQDSQFTFDFDYIGSPLKSESATNLTADFTSLSGSPLGAANVSTPFVQLAVADGDTVVVDWTLKTANAQATEVGQVVIPEPATMSLLGLGGIAAVIRRRRK